MCGRFSLVTTSDELAAEFDILDIDPYLAPRYNIAPTQMVAAIRIQEGTGRREVASLRWGFVPSWAKDASGAARMINARSETVATSAAFRAAFKARRCLVPCSGFIEWARPSENPKAKGRPHFIHRPDQHVFAMAGIWERWQQPDGNTMDTLAILTTSPNRMMESIHNRMPVILERDDYTVWLDQSRIDVGGLLCPASVELIATAISKRVNSPKHDDPACLAPAKSDDEPPAQFSLDFDQTNT
ncbi:MAG: SOS response-associated peptidase [Phycisphaerales bacterium]|nr:SOS response-associated peptidase [Phycisphaerales bacterium]